MRNYIIEYTDKYTSTIKVCIFTDFESIAAVNNAWMDMDLGIAVKCIDDSKIGQVCRGVSNK